MFTFMISAIASAGAYFLCGDIVPNIAGWIAVSTVALAAILEAALGFPTR